MLSDELERAGGVRAVRRGRVERAAELEQRDAPADVRERGAGAPRIVRDDDLRHRLLPEPHRLRLRERPRVQREQRAARGAHENAPPVRTVRNRRGHLPGFQFLVSPLGEDDPPLVIPRPHRAGGSDDAHLRRPRVRGERHHLARGASQQTPSARDRLRGALLLERRRADRKHLAARRRDDEIRRVEVPHEHLLVLRRVPPGGGLRNEPVAISVVVVARGEPLARRRRVERPNGEPPLRREGHRRHRAGVQAVEPRDESELLVVEPHVAVRAPRAHAPRAPRARHRPARRRHVRHRRPRRVHANDLDRAPAN